MIMQFSYFITSQFVSTVYIPKLHHIIVEYVTYQFDVKLNLGTYTRLKLVIDLGGIYFMYLK